MHKKRNKTGSSQASHFKTNVLIEQERKAHLNEVLETRWDSKRYSQRWNCRC